MDLSKAFDTLNFNICIWIPIMALFFYVAWRRTIRKLWALPNTTHCKYLHTINNSLPIDLMLEERCLKFIWSCINSNNTIVKSVSSSAIMYSYSSLGENYRFLSDKYDIIWYNMI